MSKIYFVRGSFRNIQLLYFFTIIFLSALSFYSYLQIKSLIDQTQVVNHTDLVKFELERQISLLKDAETGQRGYLLTNDSDFLAPYFLALQASPIGLKKLTSLSLKNPSQLKNIKTLDLIVHSRLNYLKMLIEKSQTNRVTKEDLLEGKRIMDGAREHVEKMMVQEDNFLSQRKLELQKQTKLTPFVNVVLVVCSLIILIVSYFKNLNELKVSKKLQQNLLVSESQLKETLEELEINKAQQIRYEAAKRFELIANNMPQFIWTSDIYSNLNYYSQSIYDATGFTPQTLQQDEGWLQIVHHEDRKENIAKWMHSIATGEPFLFEHRFLMKDGNYRWQLSRAVPQKDADGIIQMWVGTSTDIQEQKMFAHELDRQVQQRTQELKMANEYLENTNAELAQFAYIASHDLQEPLRKIQTFISRLVDTELTLSEKGKDYFLRIRNSSKKMQQLILDILTYSRTSNKDSIVETTDLNQVFKDAKEQLAELIGQKKAIVSASQLPVVKVITYQFEQLFTNLLSNSLKFSKKDVLPVIKIRAGMVSGSLLDMKDVNKTISYHFIEFADNGIGFEPEFNERIFGVFQRLHSKEGYDGTGIGLAIVKKIIDNHEGFITASGRLNEGAVFTIYLPA